MFWLRSKCELDTGEQDVFILRRHNASGSIITPAVFKRQNVVCEKLRFARMFLFRYQLRPADHAFAPSADRV